MDIECLEHFQKIAELKSISKVANKAHISQPALSQQMKKLEDALGKKLFVRSNRGVKLTQSGDIVLKYADNIIRTYNKMLDGLDQQQNNEIKIEAEFTIATYCLPCALLKMGEKFPGQNYNLISSSSDKIEEDVLNDLCEVGFITNYASEDDLISEKVIEEKVVLISPEDYNIPENVELKEILEQPLIILSGECIIKENLNKALTDLEIDVADLNIIARLETTEAMKTLVQNGYGVGFVADNAVKEEYSDNKIQISRIKDYKLDYNVFMINKTPENLSSATRKFVEGFKNLGDYICC